MKRLTHVIADFVDGKAKLPIYFLSMNTDSMEASAPNTNDKCLTVSQEEAPNGLKQLLLVDSCYKDDNTQTVVIAVSCSVVGVLVIGILLIEFKFGFIKSKVSFLFLSCRMNLTYSFTRIVQLLKRPRQIGWNLKKFPISRCITLQFSPPPPSWLEEKRRIDIFVGVFLEGIFK